MPACHVNDSKHWRDYDAEMRALSDVMKDVECVGIMLRLADDYDKLADGADKPSDQDNQDRKPGLGGRQGSNEHQPKKRPRRLSTNIRTNPITEKEDDRDKLGRD